MERRKSLLVIDDDADILKVLKANLELFGFSALTADSWGAAEKVLEDGIPDLVILDLTLPDGDGVDICRILKDRYPRMPIIILTARDRVSDKVTGLESGADDYLVKPFETPELIARIKVCLRRALPVEERIEIRGIEIDRKAHTVKVDGRFVELTPKEFDLLALFAANKGEVLNRETIRNSIWGDTKLYSWSRVIDVHLQHLRQKIEKDPSNPEYIVTVPGVGYKLKI